MRSMTLLRRTIVAGVAGLALAASATATAGTAAASPTHVTSPQGILVACTSNLITTVNQNTWVRFAASLSADHSYTILTGGGFHILGGPYSGSGLLWYYGHGNGGSDGYVPKQNLNCT